MKRRWKKTWKNTKLKRSLKEASPAVTTACPKILQIYL
jgi:hypothetical protein